MDRIVNENYFPSRSRSCYLYEMEREQFGMFCLVDTLQRLYDGIDSPLPIPDYSPAIERKRNELARLKLGGMNNRPDDKEDKEKTVKRKQTKVNDNQIFIGYRYACKQQSKTVCCVILNKIPSFKNGKQNRQVIWRYSVQNIQTNEILSLTSRNILFRMGKHVDD